MKMYWIISNVWFITVERAMNLLNKDEKFVNNEINYKIKRHSGTIIIANDSKNILNS